MAFNLSLWAKASLNLVFPLHCQICSEKLHPENSEPLCSKCREDIKYLKPPWCQRCGMPLPGNSPEDARHCLNCQGSEPYYDRVRSACQFHGVLRECIHQFKYNKCLSLQRPLTGILLEFAMEYLQMDKIDILVPVPLHPQKLREREFNQSELLCEGLYKHFKCRMVLNNLYRTRWTTSQSKLTLHDRKRNLTDAFSSRHPVEFCGKRILLIDDVYTSGTTINECAKVLRHAGADWIEGLTLARG